ncbi:hypothetical protein AMK19_06620 [Kitasatospora sp. CB01950]|nr:hypothetical protein AMK19_06620 [Kitasatospora sp. CB01950]
MTLRPPRPKERGRALVRRSVLDEAGQQGEQGSAFGRGEVGEELFVGPVGEVGAGVEEAAAGRGGGDGVLAAVAGVGLAEDEALAFEVVDEQDDVLRVEPQAADQVRPGERALVGDGGQDRVVLELQAVGGDRLGDQAA